MDHFNGLFQIEAVTNISVGVLIRLVGFPWIKFCGWCEGVLNGEYGTSIFFGNTMLYKYSPMLVKRGGSKSPHPFPCTTTSTFLTLISIATHKRSIHPLPQLPSRLEVRHMLPGQFNRLPRFGVARLMRRPVVKGKTPKAANLDALAGCQGIRHLVKNRLDREFYILVG